MTSPYKPAPEWWRVIPLPFAMAGASWASAAWTFQLDAVVGAVIGGAVGIFVLDQVWRARLRRLRR